MIAVLSMRYDEVCPILVPAWVHALRPQQCVYQPDKLVFVDTADKPIDRVS